MRRIVGIIGVCASLIFGNVSFAQDESEVLMTVGGNKVSLNEFENIYHKNNTNLQGQQEQSLEEYLELFINFKLKITEALALQMDTDKAFISELSGYRKQLAKPYLEDREVTQQLIQEAYDRMKYDVNAKHILVVVPNDASPEDTLKAYKKMQSIRAQAMVKNANFEKIMRQHNSPAEAKQREIIAEDLGYFTAFQMVYNFETAAYKTEVNKVSDIIRTRFGYHILKVYDKRENRGEIKAAHIMVSTPSDMNEDVAVQKRAKIDEIYGKLKEGEEFEKLAKLYSDDKGSAKRGGELPWFGSGRMVEEFEMAAFALKEDGDISLPIKTKYGWHIIKRIEKKEIGTLEEEEGEIKNKIAKDGRSTKSRTSLIAKIKSEYGYQYDEKKVRAFDKVVDDSYKTGKWNADAAKDLNDVLFVLHDQKYSNNKKEYTQQEFAKFLQQAQKRYSQLDKKAFVNEAYKVFVDNACVEFEDALLEDKYIDFRLLMREYRDGILLFELMDDKVWSKAVKDTAGLSKFYGSNKTNYMWDKRAEASIYNCQNEEIAAQAKKLIKKQAKKGYTDQYIMGELNVDSQLNCSIEGGKFQKGENDVIDNLTWEKGVYDIPGQEGKVMFVNIKQVLEPMPKSINECKGLVTADYQKYLEEEWIKELRAKYPVEVDKEVLSKVK